MVAELGFEPRSGWLKTWAAFPHTIQVKHPVRRCWINNLQKGNSFAGWKSLGRWRHSHNKWQEFLRRSTLCLMEVPNSQAVLRMAIMSIFTWYRKGLWGSSIPTGVKGMCIFCSMKREQHFSLCCLELIKIAYGAYFWVEGLGRNRTIILLI